MRKFEKIAVSSTAMTGKIVALVAVFALIFGIVSCKNNVDEPEKPVYYTVTFDSDGGSSVEAQNVESGKTAEKPTDPTKAGYDFGGWYNGASVFDFTKPVTEKITLKAKWTVHAYTITYNLDGGTNTSENPATYTIEDEITLKDAEKTGSTFSGWFNENTKVTKIAKGTTGDLTLTAKWDFATYDVTLNVNGGTISEGKNVTTYTYGTAVTLPTTSEIKRTGYDFGGWFADENCTGTAVTEISTTDIENKVFYAKWTPAPYQITYIGLPGGLENPNTTTSFTIESDSIEIKHIRTSDKFYYWYDAQEDGNKVTEIEKGSFGNRTLYARGVDFTYLNVSSMAGTFKSAELLNASNATSFRKSMTAPENATVYLDGETQKAPAWYDTETKTIWYYVPDGALLSFTDGFRLFYEMKELEYLETCDFYTGNVTNMFGMFYHCYALTTLDLSNFDTSNVTNMHNMFYNCSALTTLDVSGFDTSKVTDMFGMFYNCKALTELDLSSFDTSSVTNMSEMFFGCSALTTVDLSSFDTSNVTNMRYMFLSCNALTTLDVSSFDTSNVSNMYNIFGGCSSLTSLDLSSFNTSRVTDMSGMFSDCKALTELDLSNFDTSNVTKIGGMFSDCKALTELDLSNFDTSNVTSMGNMFSGCNALTTLDVSGFDTSSVTDMSGMFSGCNALTELDVSNFDTSNVTKIGGMFFGCSALNTIYVISGTDWSTSETLIDSSYMFSGCLKLKGGAGTAFKGSKTDKTYARVDGGTDSPGYFTVKE